MQATVLIGLVLGLVNVLQISGQTVSLFGNVWTGDVSHPYNYFWAFLHTIKQSYRRFEHICCRICVSHFKCGALSYCSKVPIIITMSILLQIELQNQPSLFQEGSHAGIQDEAVDW